MCVCMRIQAKDTKQIQKWSNTERGVHHPKKRRGGGKDISTIYYAPSSVLCSDCTDRQDLPLRGSQPGEEKRESEKMVLPTEKARRDGNTSVKGGSSSWKAEVSVHGGKGGARTPRDLLERQVQSRD